ncbi:hypothetical protein [Amycolatopsis pithecellobii]|uniref:Uncharacterized protein n=1 Tax=Amycolatopsis pithecellobii TaxID=664692 RepID=A0A6N7Z4E6_9PSEU|nr:hypothetical protein [Amycolatopsis pithecellobii]MTD56239.1 hypothetical protein [Amycolatopsis pithecellobii]
MNGSGQRRTVETRCGREISIGRTVLPAVPLRWVTVRISSGLGDGGAEWVTLSGAEAAALAEALLEQARTV